LPVFAGQRQIEACPREIRVKKKMRVRNSGIVTDAWSDPSTGAARTDWFESKEKFDECIAICARYKETVIQRRYYPPIQHRPRNHAGLKSDVKKYRSAKSYHQLRPPDN